MSEQIISDPKNVKHIHIVKGDQPIYMLSLDLQNIHQGQLNVVREYISPTLYGTLATPHYDPAVGKLESAIFNRLSDGKVEVSDESGITQKNIRAYLDPNIPFVNVPSFLVRIACQGDSQLLAHCVRLIQEMAMQITKHGISEDVVMDHRNYSMSESALDKVHLVTSAKVPLTEVKNAIPTLNGTAKISDLYAQTHKPLKKLIRRAYLLPPVCYDMYVYNNGIAKLQRMPLSVIHSKKIKDKRSHLSWGKFVQSQRSKPKASPHTMRKLEKKFR